MPQVGSDNPQKTEEFELNQQKIISSINGIEDIATTIQLGGSEKSRKRHIDRGKMLPRDRVYNLLDRGSFFLEIGLFAANGKYDDQGNTKRIIRFCSRN